MILSIIHRNWRIHHHHQGVILVSFGSTLSPSAMGAERRDMFVRIFKVSRFLLQKDDTLQNYRMCHILYFIFPLQFCPFFLLFRPIRQWSVLCHLCHSQNIIFGLQNSIYKMMLLGSHYFQNREHFEDEFFRHLTSLSFGNGIPSCQR